MGKPRELRETGEQDLFRSRLDQIINMKHELVRLAASMNSGGHRLGGAGGAFRRNLRGRPRHAALADAADGGARDLEAHVRPVGRGALRALGGEPLLPIFLRRGILLPRISSFK